MESQSTVIFNINNLYPKTQYIFRLSLIYQKTSVPYIWPTDGRFTFETSGDRPSSPGIPVVQHLRRDVYHVTWEPSLENGAHIDTYWLEGKIKSGRRLRREANFSVNFPTEEWILYYNGTENYWIISDLSPSHEYIFRVKAKNKYGWSEFSPESKSFDFTEAAMLAERQELGIVLGISIPIVVVALCVLAASTFLYVFKQRVKEKKSLQVLTLATNIRGPDVELATIRELPRRGNFIHNTNALYSSADIPTDDEVALLPHIPRDHITLTKFLGSGAFGEVFEGLARNLNIGSSAETKVAIKTLRKGASEQEKGEFLKEAQLMSNFQHEHILKLLGVCLDNDPRFIIMELMEGGDLLSYLRSSRQFVYTSNALTLLDLLLMCVDVAKGCCYLEDMHFVHRDLACRNCLVSCSDPQRRIVKIGDFGLARDIYKNDYYRKEGEGLLPVRWMSPESLVDGVFTSQSDVWAFGVLMWEIMTLGQQPYPARTNIEVLNFVRNGGRLSRPNNCPEDLHQLLLKSWSYNPEHRPSFKYCLEVLQDLKNKISGMHSVSAPNGFRINRLNNGGIANQGFFQDENHNESSGASQNADDDASNILQQTNSVYAYRNNESELSPKYLELVCDNNSISNSNMSDGYEIPRIAIPEQNECVMNRIRTLSNSSTISDRSACLSQEGIVVLIQDNCNNGESVNIADINVVSPKNKNYTNKQITSKDLSCLEQLLPHSETDVPIASIECQNTDLSCSENERCTDQCSSNKIVDDDDDVDNEKNSIILQYEEC